MVEKQEGKDYRKGNPDGELLVNRYVGEGIQKKKAGNCDSYSCGIININGAHKITLLAFEL